MSHHPLHAQTLFNVGLFQRFRQSFQFNVKSFLDQVVYLRKFGFRISNDYDVASSIFLSGILKIPDVKDCSCTKRDEILNLRAYIDVPNFEVEAKIYDIYAELLEYFPNANIDVRVIELYGRSKEELETLEMR